MRRDQLLSKKDPALGDLENSLPIQTDSVLWRQGQGCGWTIICLTHGYNRPLQKLEIDMGIYTWLPRKNQNRDMVIYTWLPRKDLQRTLLSNGLGPMNYMGDWQGFWEFHTSRSASSLDWKGERRKQNKGRITPRAAPQMTEPLGSSWAKRVGLSQQARGQSIQTGLSQALQLNGICPRVEFALD